MKLYDPENEYTKAILAREKPLKQLRKIAGKADVNSGLPGEILILVSSLEDRDFNYIQGPLNQIITKTTPEIAKEIVRFIPTERLIHYTSSISTRLGEVIDLIPPSKFSLFKKAASKEITANNNAARIIKYIAQNDNIDFFNKAITKAIVSANEADLEKILQSVPSEKIANFVEPISDAINRIGNSNMIYTLSKKDAIENFIEPIGKRMISLAPTSVKSGISAEALSFIKAIPAISIHYFIEPIGITISIVKNTLTETLKERYMGGIAGNCDRYINAIFSHIPTEYHQSISDIVTRNSLPHTEQYTKSRTSLAGWTEYITKKAADESKAAQWESVR